jgi:atypical dual specificity phosphatase
MAQPDGFSWIEKPLLAGSARLTSADEFVWLRQQGIELLISLTEERPRRDWVDEAGLLQLHVPVVDMEAPGQDQLELCVTSIEKAHERNMGVVVHCTAGLGRTGTVLACYFVAKGHPAENAMARVRRLRPGSIETD